MFFCFLFQTGCSPASAFASFSKYSSSPRKVERMSSNALQTMHTVPNPLTSNISTFPRSISPTSYSPPASPLEGDVVIPCEFCGVALEEAIVFHHQVGFKLTFSNGFWKMDCDVTLYFFLLLFLIRTNVTCARKLLTH